MIRIRDSDLLNAFMSS